MGALLPDARTSYDVQHGAMHAIARWRLVSWRLVCSTSGRDLEQVTHEVDDILRALRYASWEEALADNQRRVTEVRALGSHLEEAARSISGAIMVRMTRACFIAWDRLVLDGGASCSTCSLGSVALPARGDPPGQGAAHREADPWAQHVPSGAQT